MKEILLFLVFFGIYGYGYHLIKKLGYFLEEKRKAMEHENDRKR